MTANGGIEVKKEGMVRFGGIDAREDHGNQAGRVQMGLKGPGEMHLFGQA